MEADGSDETDGPGQVEARGSTAEPPNCMKDGGRVFNGLYACLLVCYRNWKVTLYKRVGTSGSIVVVIGYMLVLK